MENPSKGPRPAENRRWDPDTRMLQVERRSPFSELSNATINVPKGTVRIRKGREGASVVERFIVKAESEIAAAEALRGQDETKVAVKDFTLQVEGPESRIALKREIIINVPEGSRFNSEVYVRDGGVSVEGVKGSNNVTVTNGNVELSGVEGDSRVITGGNISVKDSTGELFALTKEGDISVSDTILQGDSKLLTDKGNILVNVKNKLLGIFAKSDSGSITPPEKDFTQNRIRVIKSREGFVKEIAGVMGPGEEPPVDIVRMQNISGQIVFSKESHTSS